MRYRSLLLLLLPLRIHAGFLKEWQPQETASAPVIVTGRVLKVHWNERVPDAQLTWKAETWSMTADLEVLRSFTASAALPVPHRIAVRFLAFGPSVTAIMCCSPPPLPLIAAGDTLIVPLLENRNPASEPWRLMAESGAHVTIPVRPDFKTRQTPPESGRAFLMGEFANTLSRGTPAEVFALSQYLSRAREDLSAELTPLLKPDIGDNRQQWAQIAASLHAALGIPRPSVAELSAAKPAAPPSLPSNLPLLREVLHILQPSPATDDLLIRTWMANTPIDAWGSANSLVEFASNPLTTELLKDALRTDRRGSSYVALVLANHGDKAIIPDALARAFRVVDDPSGSGTAPQDIQGAAALLRDHGSDGDLARLAAIVRKYLTLDPKYYAVLWQDATEANNPREMPVLAVVLTDRRILFRNLRYCDYALGEFQRITAPGKPAPDLEAASIQERDDEIARALESIRKLTHPATLP